MWRTALILMIITLFANADQPPTIEWAKTFQWNTFTDILESTTGEFFLSGWNVDTRCLFKLSENGDVIWEYRDLDYPFPCIYSTKSFVQTADTSIVAVGSGLITEDSQQSGISIVKVDDSGNRVWTKVYEFPDTRTSGIDIAKLPDGGFALCGLSNPYEGMDQTLILRTDANGDTLWTREWGWNYNDTPVAILYVNDGLTVFINGRTSSTPGGPHLVRYDMDGNLLWELFIEFPGNNNAHAKDMCMASTSGYHLLMDMSSTALVQTDLDGNVIWPSSVYGYDEFSYSERWSISSTMDGGSIFCGEYYYEIGPSGPYTYYGYIYKYTSAGIKLWDDNVNDLQCTAINAVIQLQEGGYLAAGRAVGSDALGFLMKYAPETGVSQQEQGTYIDLELSPNPCNSFLSVVFSLPEESETAISVYDFAGRCIDIIAPAVFPAGYNTVTWLPSDEIQQGCYLVMLESQSQIISAKCVVLR